MSIKVSGRASQFTRLAAAAVVAFSARATGVVVQFEVVAASLPRQMVRQPAGAPMHLPQQGGLPYPPRPSSRAGDGKPSPYRAGRYRRISG
jgi:hypothetical protein